MRNAFRDITMDDIVLSYFLAKSETHYVMRDGSGEVRVDTEGDNLIVRDGDTTVTVPLCVAAAVCTVPLRTAIKAAVARINADGLLTPSVAQAIDIIEAAWPETLDVDVEMELK